ncbi:cytochrome P450 [Mycena galopus ATCC 62051]|nr:cytochrome P450 [Mycena galopus ATCC 62051]
MDRPILAICLATLIICTVHYLRSSRSLVRLIPGPKSPSWIYGNMPQLLLSREYGENEFQWQERYGQVYSIKGCFGEPRLMISDPATVKYILNTSVFAFGPSQEKIGNILFGDGNVFMARGESHRHLRNLMNSSFSSKNVRAVLPAIMETARKLGDRWEALSLSGGAVDISRSLNDAALDAMGDAIFGYSFNALAGQSELAMMHRKMTDLVSNPTESMQLIDAILSFIPNSVLRLVRDLPIPGLHMLQEYKKLTDALSLRLIAKKRDEGSLASAFLEDLTNTHDRVADKEIGVHFRTILIAGQETMGSTLNWIFYMLAQMENYQRDLRQEIQNKQGNLGELDYNNMPLLNAFINASLLEVLRMYSAFPLAERAATADCILPLSHPITTTTGIQISEIPIKKGQCFHVAIAAYHRLESVWGPDAREFKPSRWLQPDPCKGPALGPHASLLAFFGGPGVCLGWRFAILELQVFVVELVRRFSLSLPKDDSVRTRVSTTLVPETSDGKRHMPVHIENIVV